MADFLLEIGLEEVPARMIATAEEDLRVRVTNLLQRERLAGFAGTNLWDESGLKVNGKYVLRSYSTPRRLAVSVADVLLKQEDLEELIEGPPASVAYKEGNPTPAAHAFAKKVGVSVGELLTIQKPKGGYICARAVRKGRVAREILAAELPKEVLAVYWAKNMYWREGKPERFVRPVRWVVAVLDTEIVPLQIAGIAAGNISRGHRVLHGEAPVKIGEAAAYKENLRNAFVVADVAERRHKTRSALDAAVRTIPGARWREDSALVETVTHLTEWPTAVLGDFEPEYLDLPEEVLVTVMRDHQKYFAIQDTNGKLLPHFLAVLNTQADEEGAAIIRHGNARVLRARFKDARFFWDFDQKSPLAARVDGLKQVTFQQELGSYHWKTEQNLAVARALAASVNDAAVAVDEAALLKAVELAKTDLTTELVKEFTELQGIVGGLYARAQGLGETVAKAIYDQYTPASTEDAIPATAEGQLLGIADRIQTIVAMFGIGNAPTGSKDPFALRRAANSIVKILAESGLPLTLIDVLQASGANDAAKAQVAAFLRERLQFYLKDVRSFAYDVVNAVLAAGSNDIRDAVARAQALTAVRGSDDFAAVSAAFKRIKNILRQAEEKGFALTSPKGITLAPEAQQLADATTALGPLVATLRDQRNYRGALALIATVRPAVDAFFDKVMVLDPDEKLRAAHLGLIDEVLRNFSGIADFSEIVTG